MAVHTDIRPAPAEPWYHWFGRPRVYLILGLIVGVLAVVWAGQRAAQGVRDNLDARLRDAGAGADAAMVTLEAEQLSALRAITFTEGIGRAIAANDIKEVNRIVAPLHANSGVPMVDVVLPSGRVVLAVRSSGAPAPVASRRGMPALAHALARTGVRRSGRFSTVVVLRSG